MQGYTPEVTAEATRFPLTGHEKEFLFFAPSETSQKAGTAFIARTQLRTMDRDVPTTMQAMQGQGNAIGMWGPRFKKVHNARLTTVTTRTGSEWRERHHGPLDQRLPARAASFQCTARHVPGCRTRSHFSTRKTLRKSGSSVSFVSALYQWQETKSMETGFVRESANTPSATYRPETDGYAWRKRALSSSA